VQMSLPHSLNFFSELLELSKRSGHSKVPQIYHLDDVEIAINVVRLSRSDRYTDQIQLSQFCDDRVISEIKRSICDDPILK
jgi:hypothetical protein